MPTPYSSLLQFQLRSTHLRYLLACFLFPIPPNFCHMLRGESRVEGKDAGLIPGQKKTMGIASFFQKPFNCPAPSTSHLSHPGLHHPGWNTCGLSLCIGTRAPALTLISCGSSMASISPKFVAEEKYNSHYQGSDPTQQSQRCLPIGSKTPQLPRQSIRRWGGMAVNDVPCAFSCQKAQEPPPSTPGPASLHCSQPGGLPQHLR